MEAKTGRCSSSKARSVRCQVLGRAGRGSEGRVCYRSYLADLMG
jgi:hypothetical protein